MGAYTLLVWRLGRDNARKDLGKMGLGDVMQNQARPALSRSKTTNRSKSRSRRPCAMPAGSVGLVCGEIHRRAPGPIQRPAGCPAGVPVVLQGTGESGAGGFGPAARDV